MDQRVAQDRRAIKVGALRPAVVLYDESHPQGEDIGDIIDRDKKNHPDLLLIMGTSLQVYGCKKMVKDFAKAVHRDTDLPSAISGTPSARIVIFVNKTAPAKEWDGIIDYHVQSETDSWVKSVVECWQVERPRDWR